MKRFGWILFIIFVAHVLNIGAQELTVKSFKVLDGDLTASVNPRQEDRKSVV